MILEETFKEVATCRKAGILINTFMVASDRYLVDFPLIAASGANTVRIYSPILTTAMLDAAWANGLYVIPTFGVVIQPTLGPVYAF